MSGTGDDIDDLAHLSTVKLLAQARSGSADAREVLYERYLERLQKWARGRVPLPARRLLDTDDIVQDVMLQTLAHLDTFDPRHSGAFPSYVRKAVRNRLSDELRRAIRRPTAEETAGRIPHKGPSPYEEVIASEQMESFERALERLTTGDQAVIMARLEHGLSYEQIALELDKPSTDAARMAVSRAVARLAKQMTEDG